MGKVLGLGECDKFQMVFVGDLHLNHIAPKTRLDDYPSTCIDKLDSLRNICIQRGFKYVCFLGDVFHKYKQPVDYLVRIISELNKFKADGIRCFSIVGNHDIPMENLDSLCKTSLGLLFEADVLEPLDEIKVKSCGKQVLIKGYDFGVPVTQVGSLSDIGDYNVAVAHMFYEFELASEKDNLTKKDIVNLGYDMYVLGHDHVNYDLTYEGNATIVRPGSFMRGTSHKYNLSRDVYVDVFTFDSRGASIERIKLNVVPGDLVFSAVATDKADTKQLNQDLQASFMSLITMLETPQKKSGSLLYKILDTLEIDVRVKEVLTKYFEGAGIFRPTV